jgi:hypothetical protein
MRKLLLGDDAEDDEASDDEDHAQDRDADDFFLEEANDEGEHEGYGDEMGEEEGTSMTYMPDLGRELLDRKHAAQETVLEAAKRKLDEKKKARKAKKKEFLQQSLSREDKSKVLSSKPSSLPAPASASTEVLELMFAGDDNDTSRDYDMRAIVKEAKKKGKSKEKNKSKESDAGLAAAESFQVDVEDSRFKGLFDGSNSHFGIDRTKAEFKETAGMKKILEAQQKRRTIQQEQLSSKAADPVTSLVDKLKTKFKDK